MQRLQPEGERHGHEIGRHRPGQHLRDVRRAGCERGLEADGAHERRRAGVQREAGHEPDDKREQRTPPEDGSGGFGSLLADQLRGQHLDAGQQPHGRRHHHHRRCPAERLVAELDGAVVTDHDGVRQAHRHDAEARQHDGPGEPQQLTEAAAAGVGLGRGLAVHRSTPNFKKPTRLLTPEPFGERCLRGGADRLQMNAGGKGRCVC